MTAERIKAVNVALKYMTDHDYNVKVSDGLVSIQDPEGREWNKYPVEYADGLCRLILDGAWQNKKKRSVVLELPEDHWTPENAKRCSGGHWAP